MGIARFAFKRLSICWSDPRWLKPRFVRAVAQQIHTRVLQRGQVPLRSDQFAAKHFGEYRLRESVDVRERFPPELRGSHNNRQRAAAHHSGLYILHWTI